MIRLAQVTATFEADFLAQYRERLTAQHLRALAAIKQCRSQASPRMQVHCSQCAHQRLVPHSCGHLDWTPFRGRHERLLDPPTGPIMLGGSCLSPFLYHPHVHLIMPAGAIDAKRKCWRTKGHGRSKGRYLFSHKALAKVFRAKMLADIEAAGLAPPDRQPSTWVVDCKAVGSGEGALVYLGRYLYRGSSASAISSPAPKAR
jgi:hypothetical protein